MNKNIIQAIENKWLEPKGVSKDIFDKYTTYKKRVDFYQKSPKFEAINKMFSDKVLKGDEKDTIDNF